MPGSAESVIPPQQALARAEESRTEDARDLLEELRFHSGRVIASSDSASGAHELRLDENVRIEGPGWICARVGGGGAEHLTRHRDEWSRAIMAHTSPVYVSCGDRGSPADREALEHIATLIDRARSYAENRVGAVTGADLLHHHGGGHREFLIRPFDQARTAIEHRLRLAGK